jgi:hypothetical protein
MAASQGRGGMRIWFKASTLVAILLAAPVSGQQMALRGIGTTSCAEFAKAYKIDPTYAETVYASWAQGLMSGANLLTMRDQKQFRDLGAKPYEMQMMQIRNYCDSHPLATFVSAVLDTFSALPSRKSSN